MSEIEYRNSSRRLAENRPGSLDQISMTPGSLDPKHPDDSRVRPVFSSAAGRYWRTSPRSTGQVPSSRRSDPSRLNPRMPSESYLVGKYDADGKSNIQPDGSVFDHPRPPRRTASDRPLRRRATSVDAALRTPYQYLDFASALEAASYMSSASDYEDADPLHQYPQYRYRYDRYERPPPLRPPSGRVTSMEDEPRTSAHDASVPLRENALPLRDFDGLRTVVSKDPAGVLRSGARRIDSLDASAAMLVTSVRNAELRSRRTSDREVHSRPRGSDRASELPSRPRRARSVGGLASSWVAAASRDGSRPLDDYVVVPRHVLSDYEARHGLSSGGGLRDGDVADAARRHPRRHSRHYSPSCSSSSSSYSSSCSTCSRRSRRARRRKSPRSSSRSKRKSPNKRTASRRRFSSPATSRTVQTVTESAPSRTTSASATVRNRRSKSLSSRYSNYYIPPEAALSCPAAPSPPPPPAPPVPPPSTANHTIFGGPPPATVPPPPLTSGYTRGVPPKITRPSYAAVAPNPPPSYSAAAAPLPATNPPIWQEPYLPAPGNLSRSVSPSVERTAVSSMFVQPLALQHINPHPMGQPKYPVPPTQLKYPVPQKPNPFQYNQNVFPLPQPIPVNCGGVAAPPALPDSSTYPPNPATVTNNQGSRARSASVHAPQEAKATERRRSQSVVRFAEPEVSSPNAGKQKKAAKEGSKRSIFSGWRSNKASAVN